MRVGVVGYSSQKFDERVGRMMVAVALNARYVESQGDLIIVSGYTNLGIPKLAYEYAKKLGYKTMGIACSKAVEYECFPCDRVHIVGDNWGDESKAFLASIDVLVRIGGGAQSKKECQEANVLGIPVIEYELEAILNAVARLATLKAKNSVAAI
jgi:hypothetical protein